jgi:hypothetical protein
MRRRRLLATTLILGLGCDKARELVPGSGSKAQAAEVPTAARLDLSTRPPILFQIYGERDDPRMIPVGVMRNGTIEPIVLASSGWREFDAIYGRAGTQYTVYDAGRAIGKATVRQGMWEQGRNQLYTLPACELLIPQAAMSLGSGIGASYTVTLFASSKPLRDAGRSSMSAAEAEAIARAIGSRLAEQAGVGAGEMAALDVRATALMTGVSPNPTVTATFMDKRADEQSAAGEQTLHMFVIADRPAGASGYQVTFSHIGRGEASDVEFRRLVDQIDVDSDGVTELALEGWKFGGDTYLLFLQQKNGAWNETFRSRPSWCLDAGSQ